MGFAAWIIVYSGVQLFLIQVPSSLYAWNFCPMLTTIHFLSCSQFDTKLKQVPVMHAFAVVVYPASHLCKAAGECSLAKLFEGRADAFHIQQTKQHWRTHVHILSHPLTCCCCSRSRQTSIRCQQCRFWQQLCPLATPQLPLAVR